MKPILAAGAVVTREHPLRGTEVVIIHRKRYGDWTLPKGKLDAGESLPAAAVREVREETGVTVRLGAPLDTARYDTVNGPKRVDYWSATVLDVVRRAPDAEVDVVAWLPLRAALSRLSYPHDQFLLNQFREQPTTTPLLILRHAKAMDRKNWARVDAARPISSRGRRQAAQLIPLLAAYGVTTVVSSSSARCVGTVRPYAEARGLTIDEQHTLSEEQGTADPAGVSRLVRRVRRKTLSSGQPAVVCGHRPVLPTIFEALDLAATSLRTGEFVVAHLTSDGGVHAVERHGPPA